ncbi:hypothetical protein AVEN_85611-1 [Araneus ventricosus]|uniref:Uncharacterized protein n=1 Tax=Araneus ventricosus TaxID=182803 RepID=A0A4Y2QAJ0_ARAVE|nr:hypothetical protein AVEN_85611-1 [Araneus ventricosus]
MYDHDPPGKPQVYKLRSNCSYCLMERLSNISKNQNNEKPRGKLPKSTKIFTGFSIQETGKYILLNANTKVNTSAGRKKSRQESEFTTLTGIREIRYERDFLCFLEEVEVMYDALKIEGVSLLEQLLVLSYQVRQLNQNSSTEHIEAVDSVAGTQLSAEGVLGFKWLQVLASQVVIRIFCGNVQKTEKP